MKKKSFIRSTIVMLLLQTALLITILVVFLYSTYRSGVENTYEMMDNFLQVYSNELDNKTDDANRLLERLIYNNPNYIMLQSEDEMDRYYASINISTLLQESIITDNNVDVIIMADSSYGNCLNGVGNKVTPKQLNLIRDFTMKSAKLGHTKAAWNVIILDGTPYIYKMYVWNGKATGAFMSADSFMDTAGKSNLENMTLVLTDKDNRLYGYYGDKQDDLQMGKTISGAVEKENQAGRKVSVVEGNMLVHCYMSNHGFGGQIKSTIVAFFVIIMMSLISALVLVAYIQRNVLIPMKHMQESMEQIKDGDYQLRIKENYDTSEFSVLKDTFNHLMDEIVGLKIQSYEKQIILQETELRAIRFQIQPHFFLNAMTTISSLSMQKKNEHIKVYIDALSKNIRYMFKSGLHTVPLSEEIRHVENYFEMQELKYPASVFYFIDVDDRVADWRIPQMLIHTIIENEYKYAVSLDATLTILIKAVSVEVNGERFLSLDIEDDGKGYPDEFLEKFQNNPPIISKDGRRVGLYSVRRMLEIMYEREKLFEISNIEPHGCLNHFLIPEHALHEMKQE